MNSVLEHEKTSVFFHCVEDCNEPIMITDRQGQLVYVNPAWCRVYGYSQAEILGKTPRILRSEHQDESFYRQMWREILDPKIGSFRGQVVNRAKDGRLVPVLLTITPYRINNQIEGFMGVALDLTEKQTMERQILRQDRLANVGMLASSLAHEIGNPLGVIRGRAEIVVDKLKSNGQSEKTADDLDSTIQSLDIIIGQIDRISKLINSLLRISRVPQEIALRPVHVQQIVLEVAALIQENCRQRDIELLLPKTDLIALTDPQHLQQILLNLAINSIHAIEEQVKKSGLPAKQTHHSITISIKEMPDHNIQILMEDTGCGLSHEVKSRMFEPFYTTKSIGQGTGLGLAIVARLVEEMKGDLYIASAGPGLGTQVGLTLLGQ